MYHCRYGSGGGGGGGGGGSWGADDPPPPFSLKMMVASEKLIHLAKHLVIAASSIVNSPQKFKYSRNRAFYCQKAANSFAIAAIGGRG